MKTLSPLVVMIGMSLGATGVLAANPANQHTRPAGSLTAPGATVEKVATGYRFTEGPVADADGNVLFADIPHSVILRFDAASGKTRTLYENTGRANGMMFDAKGRLVVCGMGLRKMVRYESDGSITTLAERYQGKRLNSPNDLDIDPRGGIYFSDPRYGPTSDMEMTIMAVYYITPAGRLIRVADDLVRPNGLILSPDAKTLYISDADGKTIYSYKVREDGRLDDKRPFARMPADHSRAADGMTVDEQGNVYGACLDGIRIWNAKGRLLQIIAVPQTPSNCTFAGPQRDQLYITARTSLYRIKMAVKGRKPWRR